jgi:hypothetical protein
MLSKIFSLRFGGLLLLIFLVAGCGQQPQEVEEPKPTVEEVVVVEESPADEPMEEVVFTESTEPSQALSTDNLPGVYADAGAPEVRYEIFDDGTWRAVWQPSDPSRGLLMEGVYAVENGEVHLRCMTLGRREAFLDGDWERRTPPNPRPRGFFRIDGASLVPVAEKTHQAFSMAPFNVTRLTKTASDSPAE